MTLRKLQVGVNGTKQHAVVDSAKERDVWGPERSGAEAPSSEKQSGNIQEWNILLPPSPINGKNRMIPVEPRREISPKICK